MFSGAHTPPTTRVKSVGLNGEKQDALVMDVFRAVSVMFGGLLISNPK